ncbi:unnamed protein product [Vitrella brassicaformis CCMP3155]|uniref:Uncharacterized protein n=2 Tax=Vitrella brassicaformis TaxID=1169539 RepID=A0A0G4GDB0_VITBC|nr:unnamed protein product [Vitrella brassicaformis CCMP3155]|eukprot:CEM27246.1 unnamed protein product [Vitrella brassicaformis CCMP3155]
MKCVAVASLLLIAVAYGEEAAFVPSAPLRSLPTRRALRSTTPKMSVEEMIGADVETGGVFDPLKFSEDEASLFRRRAVELKHGRIAMLACLGYFVQSAGVHLPDPVFSEPRPLSALTKVLTERPWAAAQIVAAIAAIELGPGRQDYENKAPGDLGYFGDSFKNSDPEEFRKDQLRELKNGRLAMIGIMGMMVQEGLTGQSVWEQIGSGNINPFS